MKQSHSGEADSRSDIQEISTFMEPEGSLSCSQQPTIGHCPEPDESSPHLYTFP